MRHQNMSSFHRNRCPKPWRISAHLAESRFPRGHRGLRLSHLANWSNTASPLSDPRLRLVSSAAPTRTEVHVLAPERIAIPAVGIAFAGDTGPGGIEARRRVGRPRPPPPITGGRRCRRYRAGRSHSRAWGLRQRRREAGAVRLIGFSSGPQRHKMTVSPIWGSPASPEELTATPEDRGRLHQSARRRAAAHFGRSRRHDG